MNLRNKLAKFIGRSWKVFSVVVLASISLLGQTATQQTTLYSSVKYKDDFRRERIDFRTGQFGTDAGWDLVYGGMRINDDQDWFRASTYKNNKHVIRDLGPLNWSDSIEVPVLEPRPAWLGTKEHPIRVDASAGKHDQWVESSANLGLFVKAVVGHMYAMHAKGDDFDFYVLFRVESLESGDNCTISWKLVAAPAQKTRPER